ncbi:MAG: hypothetical protein K6F47_10920 [Bacteroidaceae bacterium]|nr:hypothetical protein [Bacteroidaceae bacterium]
MKKNSFIAIVLAVVLGFVLSACGKDDVVHDGKSNIVYSVVGGWSKLQSNNTYLGCRFDSNGDAYFDAWTVSPSWKDPSKWTVSGNTLTVKSQEEVIFTCHFHVDEGGKKAFFTNVQTSEQWQHLSNLEGELSQMQIKKIILEE